MNSFQLGIYGFNIWSIPSLDLFSLKNIISSIRKALSYSIESSPSILSISISILEEDNFSKVGFLILPKKGWARQSLT